MLSIADGYEIPEDVINAYKDLRFSRTYKSIVLRLEDDVVTLDKTSAEGYEALVTELPDNAPRYIITDFSFTNRAGLEGDKIILIFYCPMESPVKERMIYSSSRGFIHKSLEGIGLSLEVDGKDELNREKITSRVLGRLGVG